MADEPSLGGGSMQLPLPGMENLGPNQNLRAPVPNVGIPGLKPAIDETERFAEALDKVYKSMAQFEKDQSKFTAAFGKMTDKVVGKIKKAKASMSGDGSTSAAGVEFTGVPSGDGEKFEYVNADQMKGSGSSTAVKAVASVLGAIGSATGGGGGGGGAATGTGMAVSGGGSGLSGATAAIGSAMSGTLKINGPGLASAVTSVLNMMSLPVRYAHDRIEENRAASLGMADMLGSVSTMSGVGIEDIIRNLGVRTPVYGGVNDVLGALKVGSENGYSLNTASRARSGAFYETIRQQQAFAPGAGAANLAQLNASVLGNTQAQQRAMMFTGGAMSSFGPGGVPKTLTEWAAGILKWFEGQRPGAERGKKFTKEELQSQVFPGSNMNAWFDSVGIDENMRNFFWQYVIGAAETGSMKVEDIVAARGPDIARERLLGTTASARRDFRMTGAQTTGSSMYQDYATREKSDRMFTNVMGGLDAALASVLGSLFGGMISRIPTAISELMYDLGVNALPQLGGAAASAAFGFFTGDPQTAKKRKAKIGDSGWGSFGGTGLNHLDPSFAQRLGAMMEANPNITITSGYRDGGTQARLHAAGVGMVAPAGESHHSKGLAADIGPPEEFGWIAANAHLFGLDNAAHLGEPWHVGFPGTVPMGDPRSAFIGDEGKKKKKNWWDHVKDAFSSGKDVVTGWWDMATGGSVAEQLGGLNRTNRGIDELGNNPVTKPVAKVVKTVDDAVDVATDPAGAVADAVADAMSNISIPGLSGLMDLVGGLKDVIGLAKSMFSGVTAMLSGDFSKLLGEGGPLAGITSVMGKGISNLLGLPNFAELDATNASKAFAGFIGGNKGGIRPKQKSDLTAESAAAAASSSSDNTGYLTGQIIGQSSGADGGGPAVASSGVAGIFKKYGYGITSATPAKLSESQKQGVLAALKAAKTAGFSGDELVTAVAISGRESGWNPNAHRTDNPPKYPDPRSKLTGDRGLWQINSDNDAALAKAGIIPSNTVAGKKALFDPVVSARAAKFLFDRSGFRHPWGANKDGWAGTKGSPLYGSGKYIQPVYDIAKQAKFIGDPMAQFGVSRYRSLMAEAGASGGQTSVNAYITVGGGGMGDSEARRVGTVIADTLEHEMKNRLARSY